MPVYIRHRWYRNEIDRLLRSRVGAVARDLERRGRAVEMRAKQLAPVKTGALRGSIDTVILYRDGMPVARVGSGLRYSYFVHEGTGIYGPRHARIYPRGGSVMTFNAGGRQVYVRWTRGAPGRHYLVDALPAARL